MASAKNIDGATRNWIESADKERHLVTDNRITEMIPLGISYRASSIQRFSFHQRIPRRTNDGNQKRIETRITSLYVCWTFFLYFWVIFSLIMKVMLRSLPGCKGNVKKEILLKATVELLDFVVFKDRNCSYRGDIFDILL